MPELTREQAEQVVAAVRRQVAGDCTDDEFRKAFGDGPQLMENWDYLGDGGHRWAVVWEEGPFEWAHLFPYGGIEEEFGFRLADVSAAIPDGWYSEAITSWSVGLCQA
jgi:hypothetical protein